GVSATWTRARYSGPAAIKRRAASQTAEDCRQDQESQTAVNQAVRVAAAWSRAGGGAGSRPVARPPWRAAGGRGRGGGGAVVCAGWLGGAGLAAGPRSREQAHKRLATVSSVVAWPARAGRLVIAGLPGAGCAGQGVPGKRGQVEEVPGQAAGRGSGLDAKL